MVRVKTNQSTWAVSYIVAFKHFYQSPFACNRSETEANTFFPPIVAQLYVYLYIKKEDGENNEVMVSSSPHNPALVDEAIRDIDVSVP